MGAAPARPPRPAAQEPSREELQQELLETAEQVEEQVIDQVEDQVDESLLTLGGFVEARLRHIPEAGEGIDANGWRFIVENATELAIIKLRVERI